MQIWITTLATNLSFGLNVGAEVTARAVKDMIAAQTGIPIERQELLFNNKPMNDSLPISAQGVADNDIIVVVDAPPAQPSVAPAPPASFGAGGFFDPFDPEYQRRIEEEIQRKQIDQNLILAQEESPEAFASVYMLYIPVVVNGCPVSAFVDSGAQTTIMSRKFAEKCGLLRLLDKRFSGMAVGVGQSKIWGRIHIAPIQIGQDFFNCSFSVLEDDNMDLLFGLDMLKRHQCCIDLKRNCLVIGSTEVTVPFLPEHELPQHARLHNKAQYESPAAVTAPPPTAPLQQPLPPSTIPAPAPSAPVPVAPNAFAAEDKISALVNLGFSREEAIGALTAAKGNVDVAAALLFG